MTIDLDSTIVEVHGKQKHGAAFGYTRVLGYHPLLATRAGTGEVLHARLRKGSSQRGTKRFCEELIARVRRAGATGALTLRADSGFFSWDLLAILDRLSVTWSITVHQNASVQAAIAAIPEDAWRRHHLPRRRCRPGGRDDLRDRRRQDQASRASGPPRRSPHPAHRPVQRQLWPDWRHHAFVTNLELEAVEADRFHRAHATVELAIRDLKEGAGLEHCPSGGSSGLDSGQINDEPLDRRGHALTKSRVWSEVARHAGRRFAGKSVPRDDR